MIRAASRFWKTREAGGIDPTEMSGRDYIDILPAITPESLSDQDVAHATYVFDTIQGFEMDSALSAYAAALAREYARRFADWLGYVFLNRANLTQKSKAMKALEEGLSQWVEDVPKSFTGQSKLPSAYMTEDVTRFLHMDKIDALGTKVLKVVRADWLKQTRGLKTADTLDALPITYNARTQKYVIPASRLTYLNRKKLNELGFTFGGGVWSTDTLDSKILQELPQAAQLQRGAPVEATPEEDPKDWYFEKWLPQNIDRFTKAFNSYGRSENVPYTFRFQVNGTEVKVQFQRNIDSIDEAIMELRSRYGGSSDRDGWMIAIECYQELMHATGKSAIHAIDRANNLEHSHGAMMEHFPPGVRAWYPRFLDFKYTAHIEQMLRQIEDEDLRVCAEGLMPNRNIKHRLVPPKTDYRTPKGLALEISSQPGKAKKRQMLKDVIKQYPDIADQVQAMLEERGLHLL